MKYKYLNLHEYENGADLRKGRRAWFSLYNEERSHQGLKGKTPDEVYNELREAA